MYHPYLRGKQYELITIRELAPLLQSVEFRPIIEPVREGLGKGQSGLEKALRAVSDSSGRAIVIVNPHHGELYGTAALAQMLDNILELPGISAGILLKPSISVDSAMGYYETHASHAPAFIHDGFREGKSLAERLGPLTKAQSHVFLEASGGKLYQKHFAGAYRVLLRDGFKRQRRNIDYDFVEPFSDLHVTYPDEGMDGFGDFLIVGDDYSESGGPAYAVAIHLTFIDSDQDDSMQIYHFKSKRGDTQKDPAGKFKEALAEMIATLDAGSKVLETNAVEEFRRLHQQGHFPGLGYLKKLSMSHHIETLADYFNHAA